MSEYLLEVNKLIYQNSAVIDSALSSIIPMLVYSATTHLRDNTPRLSDVRGEFLERVSRLYISYTKLNFDEVSRDWLDYYIRKMSSAELAAMLDNRYNVALLNYIASELRIDISRIVLADIAIADDFKKPRIESHTCSNTLLLYSHYEYMCKLYASLRAHYMESVVMSALNPVFNRFISKFVNGNPEILIMFLESNAIPYLSYNGENILIYRAMILTPRSNISADVAATREGLSRYLSAVISANKLKTKVMSRCDIIKHIILHSRRGVGSRVNRDAKK